MPQQSDGRALDEEEGKPQKTKEEPASDKPRKWSGLSGTQNDSNSEQENSRQQSVAVEKTKEQTSDRERDEGKERDKDNERTKERKKGTRDETERSRLQEPSDGVVEEKKAVKNSKDKESPDANKAKASKGSGKKQKKSERDDEKSVRSVRKNAKMKMSDAAVQKNAVAERVEEKIEASVRDAKKLDRLKKKIDASDLSKIQARKKKKGQRKEQKQEQKKKKSKSQRTVRKKKTFAEKIRDQFRSFFDEKADRAQQMAEAKWSKKSARLGKVADGDETLPQLGVKEHGGYDDCWIEDQAVLTDRSHRKDLELVKNNENNGQLWHENARPFWRNKVYQKEVPPVPPEKTMSRLLLDFCQKKLTLSEPSPDPTKYFEECSTTQDLALKDEIWFTESNVLSNTNRSILNVMADSIREVDKNAAAKQGTKLVILEPATVISYYRHDNTKREKGTFVKAPPGKPLKAKKRGSPSPSSSTSGSSSSSSSTSGGTNEGKEAVGKMKPQKPAESVRGTLKQPKSGDGKK